MIYTEYIDKLKTSMLIKEKRGSGKHTINKAAPFLPFETREPERPKFKRGFSGVAGELSRIIYGKELEKDFDILSSIDGIVATVNIEDSEDKKYFTELIKETLINKDGDIKLFHPMLFNYIQLADSKEANGEKKIAQFIYDIILDNKDFLNDSFTDYESSDLLVKLILKKLKGLTNRNKGQEYVNNLPLVTSVAVEDFKFLMNHTEFLLKNFQNLLAYYYFSYITQLSVKLNKHFKGDYNSMEEIYYLLDWESASKNRRSDPQGYRLISSESRKLLININILEHLNFLFNTKGKNFQEILELYQSLEPEEQRNTLETIREWVYFYREHFEEEPIEVELDLEALVKALGESLEEKIELATMSRYTKSISEIGKRYFLKRRGGTFGYMLNITQEMLLAITAVAVKEEKITLKELFKEYERRGLFFDQYSKDSIVELLGRFNLIDKKSDSGDAQYVKAIL